MKADANKSKKKRILLNREGSVLPQLLVAGALIAAVSTSVLQYTKTSSKSSKFEAEKINQRSLINQLQDTLRTRSACTATLAGRAVNSTAALAQLNDGTSVFINLAPAAARSLKVFGSPGTAGSISIMDMSTDSFESHGAAYELKNPDGTPSGVFERVGKFFLEINYRKGIHYNGAGALIVKSDKVVTDSTLGQARNTKLIPILAVYESDAAGSTGNIKNCTSLDDEGKSTKQLREDGIASLNSFSEAYCSDLFDGSTVQDGRCRHITVHDDSADYAATLKGNVIIQESNFSTGDNLNVEGALSAGLAASIGDSSDGTVAVNNSISVGNVTAPDTQGTAHFENSVGVGTTPSAQTTSLKINGSASFGSGWNPPATNGSVSIKNNLAIGPGSSAQSLNAPTSMHLSKNMGVGTAVTSTGTGYIDLNRSLTIGNQSEEGNGNITANGYVDIPNQDVDAAVPEHAATQAWVANKVAKTLDPNSVGDATSIFSDIMAANPNESGFSSFCRGTKTANLLGPVSQSSAFSSSRCNMVSEYCSKDGSCNTVYAESGGVISSGDIVTSSGWIRTNKSNGLIKASGTLEGNVIRAKSSICLNGVCKTSWDDITSSHGSCQTRSSGQTCSDGYFVRRVNLNKSNFTYPTSYTSSGAFGVSKNESTTSVVDSISFQCCKMIQN